LRTDSHYLKSLKQVSSFVKGFEKISPRPQFLEDFEHLPPEQLLSAIMKKDARIRWLMAEIKGVLNQDKENAVRHQGQIKISTIFKLYLIFKLFGNYDTNYVNP
jgi:hypothetical protein